MITTPNNITLVHMALEKIHPLKAFRDAHNISQEQAGALVRITQAMWSRLETESGFASPSVAKRIEELTGVAADSLLNWNNDSGGVEDCGHPETTQFTKDMP